MSLQPFIRCPRCGDKIELEARPVQGELSLGPIELRQADKNKLDTHERISHAQRAAPESSRVESGSFPAASASPIPLTEHVHVHESSTGLASCEEDLPERLQTLRNILGEKEWSEHAPLWRSYSRDCPRGIDYAIEDWKLQRPEKQRAVKNRPGWMTDRFQRAEKQLNQVRKSA